MLSDALRRNSSSTVAVVGGVVQHQQQQQQQQQMVRPVSEVRMVQNDVQTVEIIKQVGESVKHPLENVDGDTLTTLQIPLKDRFYMSIGCLRDRVSLETSKKLERQKAQEAVEKLETIAGAYKLEIGGLGNKLASLALQINTARFNLKAHRERGSADIERYEEQLKDLLTEQVELEALVKEKKSVLQSCKAMIKAFRPKDQKLGMVVAEYASVFKRVDKDSLQGALDDDEDDKNDILNWKMATASESPFVFDEDDDVQREVERRFKGFDKKPITFEQSVSPPKKKKIGKVVPKSPDDDDDDDDENQDGQLEKAHLLPAAPVNPVMQKMEDLKLQQAMML